MLHNGFYQETKNEGGNALIFIICGVCRGAKYSLLLPRHFIKQKNNFNYKT